MSIRSDTWSHDRSFARYFAYLNLFLFFMLVLVLGKNLVVLFVGWEGVGLASYLLIGFWFEDPREDRRGAQGVHRQPRRRYGFRAGGFPHLRRRRLARLPGHQRLLLGRTAPSAIGTLATAIGLLLLLGACGKSAQIPLHVWLPDAMAGPTPVSALIHAATMVTAGVYLLARLNGLYLARARGHDRRRVDRRRDRLAGRDHGRHAVQSQEGARVFDDLADRLDGHGLRRRRILRRALPPR